MDAAGNWVHVFLLAALQAPSVLVTGRCARAVLGLFLLHGRGVAERAILGAFRSLGVGCESYLASECSRHALGVANDELQIGGHRSDSESWCERAGPVRSAGEGAVTGVRTGGG